MWPSPRRPGPRFITFATRRQSGDAVRHALDALRQEVHRAREEIRELRQREIGPALTIERAGELLQCSRSKVHELINEGKLVRAPKHGKKTQVTTASVYRLLEHGQQEQAGVKHIRSRTNPSLDEELDAITVR